MIGALVLAAAIAGAPQPSETVAEIRVHGNATIPDAKVIELAGVTMGMPLQPDSLSIIEHRLRDSGRFDEVQVRKRYRTLEMDQVSIVLLVHERPGVTPSGEPPSVFRRIRNRLMFLPILNYEDGYGWTYGGRTSLIPSHGVRLSVPLSWGATRRATLEAERTFHSGPFTRLFGTYGISQRENPFFELDDRRVEVSGRAERRLFGALVLGAGAAHQDVTFGGITQPSQWTTGADVTLDTREDPAYPVDAVVAGIAWDRLHTATDIDRVRYDLRGYKRVFHQVVVAGRAEYDTASAPLPPYEAWLVGGANLRGLPAGTLAGDERLAWSLELRAPFSSPLSTGRVGFDVFLDGGVAVPHGLDIRDRPMERGAGAGLFLIVPFVKLNLDVAHSLDGHGTRVHFGTGFTF